MQRNSARVKVAILIPLFLTILVPTLIYGFSAAFAVPPPAPVTLDPKTIPKYVNQLVVPPVYVPDTVDAAGKHYTVSMVPGTQQILPTGTPGVIGNPSLLTNVWGYQGNAVAQGNTLAPLGAPNGTSLPNFFHSPSSTFEATIGQPSIVTWVNGLTGNHLFAVDPTLKWANPWLGTDNTKAFPEGDVLSRTGGPFPPFPPGWAGPGTSPLNPTGLNAQNPVPAVPHLHGAEVLAAFDGGPEAWWTSTGLKGPHYATNAATAANSAIYYYHNAQEPNTLWYHDHALGITRINVMSGLAGFYLLRDPAANTTVPIDATELDEYLKATFPYGISEIPIAIQDRTFTSGGQLWFPQVGINPTVHPYWMPEFFGDTIMVNGRVWPNLNVTTGWYRFRLLDGSNARFYTLSFDNKMPFTVIGQDGGYLQAPATVTSITMAPGERSDILVQFTPAMVGKKIILTNTAKAPFPNGAKADPQTVGQIMQFTVFPAGTVGAATQGVQTIATLPAILNPTLTGAGFPTLPAPLPANTRLITLNEVMGAAGPVMAVINGQYYDGVPTETPANGSTEDWIIINLTADTHPIHTHLVTMQLVRRQPIQAAKYLTAWLANQTVGGVPVGLPPFPRWYTPTTLDPTPYLQGKIVAPTPTEMGWKDTLQMHPGEITVVRIRFTQQNGAAYPFDPTAGNGYVWHCHIVDHEDNEMMRPLIIQ